MREKQASLPLLLILVMLISLSACRSSNGYEIQTYGAQGERGLQGQQGPIGPAGPAGPQGPAGPVGPSSFIQLIQNGTCQRVRVQNNIRGVEGAWGRNSGWYIQMRLDCPLISGTQNRMIPISGGGECLGAGLMERSSSYGANGWQILCFYDFALSDAEKEIRRRDIVLDVLCCG